VGAEGTRLEWTHVTCAPTLTHFARHRQRGATALEAIGILPGYQGVSVHDGWASYRYFHTARHALYDAHHVRALTFVHEEVRQLTLQEVADPTGVSKAYVTRLEYGQRLPERDALLALLLAAFSLPVPQANRVLLLAGYAPLHHKKLARSA
jgi:hypothetical protein